ncbi:hypothetical protein H4582DRAFT_1895591 [Lactarius indigo]|nr:hypothetical protein H4582DRAFT_1895591 [Lactarius indigo]
MSLGCDLFKIPKPIFSVPWVLIVPGCSLKIFNSSRSKPRANCPRRLTPDVFDHQTSLVATLLLGAAPFWHFGYFGMIECNLQYHHVPLSFVPEGTMRRTALCIRCGQPRRRHIKRLYRVLCRSIARQMGSSIVHISQTCVGVYHLGGNRTISTVQ